MKNWIFVALWALSFWMSFAGKAFGYIGFNDASAGDVRGAETENVIYRCYAKGLSTANISAFGDAEAFDIAWAQRLSLQACSRRGGMSCRIDHCFREEAAGDQQ